MNESTNHTTVDSKLAPTYSAIAGGSIMKDVSGYPETSEEIERIADTILKDATQYQKISGIDNTSIRGLMPNISGFKRKTGQFFLNYTQEHTCIVVPDVRECSPQLMAVYIRLFNLLGVEQCYFKPMDPNTPVYKGRQDDLLKILGEITSSYLATDEELSRPRTVVAGLDVTKALAEHLQEKFAKETVYNTGSRLTQDWFNRTFSKLPQDLNLSVQGQMLKVLISIISRFTSSSHENTLKRNIKKALENSNVYRVTPRWCVNKIGLRFHDMRALNSCLFTTERDIISSTDFNNLLNKYDRLYASAANGNLENFKQLLLFNENVRAEMGQPILRILYDRLREIGAEKQKRLAIKRKQIESESSTSKTQLRKNLTIGTIVLSDDEKRSLLNTKDPRLTSRILFILATKKMIDTGIQLYHMSRYITRETGYEMFIHPEQMLDDPVLNITDYDTVISICKTLVISSVTVDTMDKKILSILSPNDPLLSGSSISKPSVPKSTDDLHNPKKDNTSSKGARVLRLNTGKLS
jgi:hypothetical protein